MKPCFIIFLIFAVKLNAFDLDSLESEAKKATGYEKLLILNELSATYEYIPPEKRLQFAHDGLGLAKKMANDTLIADFQKHTAIAYYYDFELDSSKKYFKIALKSFKKLKNNIGISACLNNLGLLYSFEGNYAKALEYYFDALRLKETIQDTNGKAKAYNNIGQIYYAWNNFRKAKDYFLKAYELYILTDDSLSIPSVMHNIGASYMNIGLEFVPDSSKFFKNFKKFDKHVKLGDSTKYYFNIAIAYIDSALDNNNNSNNLQNSALLISNLGVIRAYQGKNKAAILFFKDAVKQFENAQNPELLSRAYINLGVIHAREGNTSEAENFLLKAASIAEEISYAPILNDAYSALMHFYRSLGDYKNAFEFSLKSDAVKDSIFNEEVYSEILELEEKYQNEKKDAELKISLAEKEALSKNQFLYIGLLILMLIAMILLAILLRYKSKTNRMLAEKNKQLAEFNVELTEIKNNLYDVNVSKDKFFSIISHDLKNPISSFKQVTKFLHDEFDELSDHDKREIVSELKYYSEHLHNLLENLLTWSRAQRGNINFNPEYEDISQIAEYTIDQLKIQAANKGINIINKIPENTVAYFDANLTSTVIRNLISNAIKYSKSKSVVELSSSTDSTGLIHITITDTGTGISPKVKEKLFQISDKITTNGTANESGTGLGLIICKEFVERQGGTIYLESELKKGSKFTFTIHQNSLTI